MNISAEMELNDKNLLPKLQEKIRKGEFHFIKSAECVKQIVELRLEDEKLRAENVEPIWQLLIEDAISHLKMSDSREWSKDFKEPGSEEQWSNLKAFGVDKLKQYFVQFRQYEKVLYGAVRYYHEHTLHVFRVWMLGALLLDDCLPINYPYIEFFNDLIVPALEPETDKEGRKLLSGLILASEIQAMWCIIALSHDLGYPLQKVDDINNEARKMLRNYAKVNLQDLTFNVPQQHHFINDFILRFISSRTMVTDKDQFTKELLLKILEGEKHLTDKEKRRFRTHIQSKYYLKYSKSLEDFEHGIFSAILLMRSLTYFLESDFDLDELKPLEYSDARQCTIRREILRAIAGHTCEQIYHIRPDTLSFLLILCDELQSWGRPTIEEILSVNDAESPSSRLIKYGEQEVDFEIDFYDKDKDFYDRTRSLFQRYHTLLRAAVDTPGREFSCQFRVMSKVSPGWVCAFNFVSKKKEAPKFKFTIDDITWNLWEDKYETIVEKLKN